LKICGFQLPRLLFYPFQFDLYSLTAKKIILKIPILEETSGADPLVETTMKASRKTDVSSFELPENKLGNTG